MLDKYFWTVTTIDNKKLGKLTLGEQLRLQKLALSFCPLS